MAKIWGVSKGEYSDYRVVAIFSTRKMAQAYLDEYNKIQFNQGNLQEFYFDPDPPELVTFVEVNIAKGGDVIKASGPHMGPSDSIGFRSYHPFHPYRHGECSSMWWNVRTDSMERAIKVANEKRAMLIDADAWGDCDATRALLGAETHDVDIG
jgi:hypothetical protein